MHRTPDLSLPHGAPAGECTCRSATSLTGLEVGIVANEYVHRWSLSADKYADDLLDRIGTEAKSILEFGCGEEASWGEALKKRQKCRVVGIELDPDAAEIAKKRVDEVHRGDVREIVRLLNERFDWIIGGDIVEHLDDPWSVLADLRRLSAPADTFAEPSECGARLDHCRSAAGPIRLCIHGPALCVVISVSSRANRSSTCCRSPDGGGCDRAANARVDSRAGRVIQRA